MSQHTITRIANVLGKQFQGLIDMSDCNGRPADQMETKFLTRALAALCVKNLSGVDPEIAAAAVTDGFHDNGLDAIHFNQRSDTLLMVQTKWSQSGDKPLDGPAAGSFITGVEDLLAAKFERFNERIRRKKAEVRAALYSERPVKIRLVTAHTAEQPTPVFVQRKIDDLIEQLNEPVPIAKADYLDQAGVYRLVTSESQPAKIKLQIGLRDLGQIRKPFFAYYGRVHVREVSAWRRERGNALFNKNLWLFYNNFEVNNALRRTLETEIANFWYFNNGITLICDSVSRNLAGSPGNTFGVFTCEGAGVVNGIQTVGTIGSADLLLPDPDDEGRDPQSWVQLRIISLESCPPEFSRRITRAANLQNAVGNREFAAMDPQQHRLATDFALDRRKYAYRSGEPDPKGDEGCGIVEATQALGCAHSVELAVQVKREIGVIWADTDSPPYTEIFNEHTSSTRVWRSILVLRVVDEELQHLRSSGAPRADMLAIHMNRLVLHLVYRDPKVRQKYNDHVGEEDLVSAARSVVRTIFGKVSDYLEEHHAGDYLASLSKNSRKCDAMVERLKRPDPPASQGNLFDG